MKLTNLAKTVVLGMAVLLASSAFASNKGTLLVGESFEVNGQQLKAGEYQVRWNGTGSTVEVSFMENNKEVAKTSAKLVTVDKAYNSDSAILDHSNGKKCALDITPTEKAEMSSGK
jgi:hypothetical protein